jgi:hypothetical protein
MPTRAKEVRRHLRPSIAGEDAFLVEAGHTEDALAGLEVREVPDVEPRDERTARREVEVAPQELT